MTDDQKQHPDIPLDEAPSPAPTTITPAKSATRAPTHKLVVNGEPIGQHIATLRLGSRELIVTVDTSPADGRPPVIMVFCRRPRHSCRVPDGTTISYVASMRAEKARSLIEAIEEALVVLEAAEASPRPKGAAPSSFVRAMHPEESR